MRPNRKQRRRNRAHVRSFDPRMAVERAPAPAILQGLPGGEVYVSEEELERYAMTVFEALAVMHPGMEQRKIHAKWLRLEVRAPRASVESGLIEVHGDVSLEQMREFAREGAVTPEQARATWRELGYGE